MPTGITHVFRPIEPAWPRMEVTMVWCPDSVSPALQEFLDLV